MIFALFFLPLSLCTLCTKIDTSTSECATIDSTIFTSIFLEHGILATSFNWTVDGGDTVDGHANSVSDYLAVAADGLAANSGSKDACRIALGRYYCLGGGTDLYRFCDNETGPSKVCRSVCYAVEGACNLPQGTFCILIENITNENATYAATDDEPCIFPVDIPKRIPANAGEDTTGSATTTLLTSASLVLTALASLL